LSLQIASQCEVEVLRFYPRLENRINLPCERFI
jgi:hypothetical protein